VFTEDDIHTFIDVVIIDPTRTNLFPRSCSTQGFVVFNVAQAKEQNYHNRHPVDQLLPLIMKVFGCLHKQVDVFLHNYVNAIWNLKKPKCLSFLFWLLFFGKKFQSHC
jgi:hypothetical protein